MKGKYLLVILCLAVSFGVNGQHRKSRQQADTTAGVPAAPADNSPAQGASGEKVEDIIPENVNNFCIVLTQLITDATTNFDRIRGKEIETISNSTTFTSMGGVPGAITSWLERTPTKWHYQGIVFQGSSKDDMQVNYNRFKNSLDNCLPPKGYVLNTPKSSSAKPETYPERQYAMGSDDEKAAGGAKGGKHVNSPKVTLSVDYTAGTDIYVITVNIWSN